MKANATEVHLSDQLTGQTKLWRYMSLDKLVDLLSTTELFFAPLAFFVKADPFEGYLPAASIDAIGRAVSSLIRNYGITITKFYPEEVAADRSSGSFKDKRQNIKTISKALFQAIM